MKASELVKLLQQEIEAFGDQEITVYCPEHSGDDGDPVAIHGLGWFGSDTGERSTFIECFYCHDEAMTDKLWSKAMDEVKAEYGFEYPEEDWWD